MSPFTPKDEYKEIPCVVYYRLEPNQRASRRNYVCFGQMKHAGVPSAIRYVAPINPVRIDGKTVADGALGFYLTFMKQVLTRPESPKFMVKALSKTVHFRLESEGLEYYRALFFLTWFRYVHHYPEIIDLLFTGREKDETLDYTFRRFQLIHKEFALGKFLVTSKAASNELVMYDYGARAEPISLEKLWANMKLASKRAIGVQECFK